MVASETIKLQCGTLPKRGFCKDLLNIAIATFHKKEIIILGWSAIKDHKIGDVKSDVLILGEKWNSVDH